MKKIYFCLGHISEAIEKLRDVEEPSFIDFNGIKLLSSDSEDQCYIKVTGKTKDQLDAEKEERVKRIEKERQEHKERIPALIERYLSESEGLILVSMQHKWREVLPIRLGDLYRGMEIGATLDIAIHTKDYNFGLANEVFKSQDHSGMSYCLVKSMVGEFAINGKEFVKYLDSID